MSSFSSHSCLKFIIICSTHRTAQMSLAEALRTSGKSLNLPPQPQKQSRFLSCHLGLVANCQNDFRAARRLQRLAIRHDQTLNNTEKEDCRDRNRSKISSEPRRKRGQSNQPTGGKFPHLYLMDYHRLVRKLHQGLGKAQCQGTQASPKPADKNQRLHRFLGLTSRRL